MHGRYALLVLASSYSPPPFSRAMDMHDQYKLRLADAHLDQAAELHQDFR